jgi:hypothetical protein
MALTPTGHGRLRVLDACREGWIAFGRAPLPFLLFSLLSSLATVPFGLLMVLGGTALVMAPTVSDLPEATLPRLIVLLISLGAFLVGLLLAGLVMLVTTLGFCRGAWLALEGHQPRFADLIRWDGAAVNRLILAWTAWQLLLLVGLVPLGLIGWSLAAQGLGPSIWWPIGLIALVFSSWLGITQTFINPLCLLNTAKPFAAVRSGIKAVQGQWWRAFGLCGLLVAVMVVISGASASALAIALAPVIGCINMAAYRQIFGSDDRLGLTIPRP